VATSSKHNPREPVRVVHKTLNLAQHHEMVSKRGTEVKEDKVVTTPELVEESNRSLFSATMNLPNAAKHCGMTEREMKMTFREYMKYNPLVEPINKQEH
jgi:hypothetical protein